jgi:mannose-1-phosphate guanylyltransferase
VKAFLLAGGLGTRMGEITRDTPKCLLPVGGRPLLARWLDSLAQAGCSGVLLNTHYLAQQVRDYVASIEPPLEVTLFHEETLLGSGGTLAANRDFVPEGEAFIVSYADNASCVDLRGLVQAHRDDVAATLGLFRVPDPQNRGVVELDAAGRVVDFVEKPSEPRSDLAWAGLLVGGPQLLDAIPASLPADLGRDVLPALLGRMRGLVVEGYHADVGTPGNYRQVLADFEAMASADAGGSAR